MDTLTGRWTEGDWEFDPDRTNIDVADDESVGGVVAATGHESVLCTVWCDGVLLRDEAIANAHLIAAAPTQNDALAAAVATIERDRLLWSGFPQQRKDDWELMLSEMKAALAKARGEQP